MIHSGIRPRYLIVNADDFGLTKGVTDGILEGMARGIVTSTSAMVATECGLTLLSQHASDLKARVGIHLQLTGGVPLAPRAEIQSLLAEDWSFPVNRRALGNPDRGEIQREWNAQIRAFRAAGIEPTHIDTHHHVHKEPLVFAAYCSIARQYGLPARSCDPVMTRALRDAGVACPDGFECGWSGAEPEVVVLADYVEAAFAGLDDGSGAGFTLELMCHPGHGGGHYRQREFAALCDPQLPARLAMLGIQLANWSNLSHF